MLNTSALMGGLFRICNSLKWAAICIHLLHCSANLADDRLQVRTHSSTMRPALRYLLYQPSRNPQSEPAPLVLFLHGGGEGGQDIELVKKHGLPKLIAAGQDFPFFVVAPQNPSQTQFWDDQALIDLLDELQRDLPVDSRRVYLTGLSRGAYGAWRLAIQNPNRFAALIPISGGGPAPYASRISHLPVWVFHGARDQNIPLEESQRMVQALKAAHGNVRFTIYPEAGHDAWTATYDDPQIYQWLLQQYRQ